MKRSSHTIAASFLLWSWVACTSLAQTATSTTPSESLARLRELLPKSADLSSLERAERLARFAQELESNAASRAASRSLRPEMQSGEQIVRHAAELLRTKAEVDRLLSQMLNLRDQFAKQPAGPQRREAVRGFLHMASTLIDLSGRLRYLLSDVLREALGQLPPDSPALERLMAELIRRKSSIGASLVASAVLYHPLPERRLLARLETPRKLQALKLIGVCRSTVLLDVLADFVFEETTPPELVLAGISTIRQVGLPQSPRPGQDRTLPEPEILAEELLRLLDQISSARLSPAVRQRRANLILWLQKRKKQGTDAESYRWGNSLVRPGDWLLMRNPSPYNLFTDLSPGLFTHVGVVASEIGSDGIRRMVLVDLPEIGTKMQTTNFDLFVQRTLHYLVLRHDDPRRATAMGQAARDMIGNPTQFDLNFRTDRVEKLRGVPLAGQKIHTYCAGLLLLCAQASGAPRNDFFPIPEFPAGGLTVSNLAKLGLTFGENFVSPTGALFSPRLRIAGRLEPMYDPHREIEEAIYDHFARRIESRKLSPSPNLFQSLRLRLAEASKTNRLLAEAMARAANVDQELDLVAAAKAAAVIETLDEIAEEGRDGFSGARSAMRAAPESGLAEQVHDTEIVAAIRAYRRRHAELYKQFVTREISPRGLRIALVEYYTQKGKKQLDDRFFHGAGNR